MTPRERASSELQPFGREFRSGSVDYIPMSATINAIRDRAPASLINRMEKFAQWDLRVPFRPPADCFHGGAFFDAIGDEFDGVANFVLCHLPEDGLTGAEVVERCRDQQLFIRDPSTMGANLGKHAIRIAVKDRATQRRMIAILADVTKPLCAVH